MTDIQLEIANLSQMAEENARQGNLERALQLHEESLKLSEQSNDMEGKASNLSQMARLVAQQGDKDRSIELFHQSAIAFAEIKAYGDLVNVLANLANSDESKSPVYLAQAIWLSLRIEFPFEGSIALLVAFARLLPPSDILLSLCGTTMMYICSEWEGEEAELEQFQELGINILEVAAAADGVRDREGFQSWFLQKQLNQPELFFPELFQQLEACVGNNWFFDRFDLIRQA